MSLQHQKAAIRGICPRCGKSYTEGRERDHHCGDQIGEERLAPPGVIVESYRLAMGLPPAKDAPADTRVNTHVNKSVNKSVDTVGPVNTSGPSLLTASEPPNDRRTYLRDKQRESRARRAAEKAANGAAADGNLRS